MISEIEKFIEILNPTSSKKESFSYKQIKNFAEEIAKKYGCEWAKKYPNEPDAIKIRNIVRRMVMANVPKDHANKYMVWSRVQSYAMQCCQKNNFM